jgi:hypothetical protein
LGLRPDPGVRTCAVLEPAANRPGSCSPRNKGAFAICLRTLNNVNVCHDCGVFPKREIKADVPFDKRSEPIVSLSHRQYLESHHGLCSPYRIPENRVRRVYRLNAMPFRINGSAPLNLMAYAHALPSSIREHSVVQRNAFAVFPLVRCTLAAAAANTRESW